MCISTRGFHYSTSSPTTTATNSSSSSYLNDNKEHRYDGPFLLPIIDLLNHDPENTCTTLQYDDATGTFTPASETRDLYKWVHNGHPFEVLIHDTDPGKEERYYLPIENLTKIMDYPVYKEPEFTVEAPKLSSKTLQTSLTDAFEQPVKSSLPLDKPLSSVTLGEFLEALKSIK